MKEGGFTNGHHLSSYKSRPGLCHASQTEWRESQDWAGGSYRSGSSLAEALGQGAGVGSMSWFGYALPC